MELNELVVSRDLAEKLKSRGFPQNTVFSWVCKKHEDYAWLEYLPDDSSRALHNNEFNFTVAAPTLAEIQDAVGWYWRGINSEINKEKYGSTWALIYNFNYDEYDEGSETFIGDSLERVMVDLWLWLKENGSIQKEEYGTHTV